VLAGTHTLQKAEAALVLAVDDHGSEAAPAQLFRRAQVIGAMLDVNFQLAQDGAQKAHSSVVGGNYQ
jgi:hypothetical protein